MEQYATRHLEDDVVVEEPLEIRVNNHSVGVTMRTPGDDFDLAVGLLSSEGFINSNREIGTIAFCPGEDQPELRNVVNVTLVDRKRHPTALRQSWVSSSCGLCGKTALEVIRRSIEPIPNGPVVDQAILADLPQLMKDHQSNFNRTGGIHAAALFDTSAKLILIREDLGRHNAVDKVVGASLRTGIQTTESILVVSGRLGFEIAQKAAVARIPIVVSVSAPSSLAVELALEVGITAIGFVRNRSMNIYSHPQRVVHGLSNSP